MKISVIIPVYNEAKTIREIIRRVKAVRMELFKPVDEIIIVDDGSTDGTRKILIDEFVDEIINGFECKVYFHHKNMGKGAAIITGLEFIIGDIVIIQDADLEYNPQEYPELIKPIIDDNADVVYGSRFMGSGEHRVLFFWHYVANKILTLITNIFTGHNFTDMMTGHKAFRTDVIKNIELKENRFGFEPEITVKIAQKKCRIFEVGISYYGRGYDEGKKIRWKDAFVALWCIIKYRFMK